MCGRYLKFGKLMEIIPEDYMISLTCAGEEIKHCVAWVLRQELVFYKIYDASVLSFSTDYYNEVCTITIDLKPTTKTVGVNEKLNLRFMRHV